MRLTTEVPLVSMLTVEGHTTVTLKLSTERLPESRMYSETIVVSQIRAVEVRLAQYQFQPQRCPPNRHSHPLFHVAVPELFRQIMTSLLLPSVVWHQTKS
jgi:hypothetical protein